jgi:ribosomal protein S6--L-glutamate ligase
MKISILTNNDKTQPVKQLVNSIQSRGHKASVLLLDKVKVLVSNNSKGYDGLYYSDKSKTLKLSKANIGEVVLPRMGANLHYGAKVIHHLTENMGIYCPISSTGLLNASDKLKSLQLASQAGIKTPKTIMGNELQDVSYIIKQLGLPVIIKFVYGSLGVGVSIVETRIGLKTTLQSFSKLKKPFIIQEFINAGNRDIRAVVLGNSIISAYQRIGRSGDFRANLSQNGRAVSISLTETEKSICIKAAKSIGLEMAGIDIIRNLKGQPYLIEVNANFGFKGQDITGVNFADEMVKFIEQKVGNQALRNINNKKSKRYIDEIFPVVFGKKIHFIDRANRKRSITIKTIQDLEVVMYNSFRVNI